MFLSLFCTSILKAQLHGTTVSMSVTITIIRGNSVDNAQSLNLNTLTTSASTADISSYNPNAGKFKIVAQPGSSVLVNVPGQIELHDMNGNVLKVKTNTPIYNSQKNQKAAVRFCNNEGGEARVSQSGSLYVWMGGKMLNKRPIPGKYKGTYTTTIEYN